MNALLDETRSERLDLGLAFMRQLRVSPTVAAVLAEEKPASMTWGDFALLGMHLVMSWRSSRGDVRGVIRQGVSLVGPTPDGTETDATNVRRPDGRQGPPSKPPAVARKISA